MLVNLFRRSTDHKHRVNKKLKLPSTCK